MPKFVPLVFDGIEEGRFKTDVVDKAIAEVQAELIKYCKKHGEKAKGAKAGVVIKITLAKEDKGDGIFSIKATAQQVRPCPPASVTMAMVAETDVGDPALFTRASGSTNDSPVQGVLCTQDGRNVDLVTGQAEKKS
jgi:hypothetical protein